MSRATGRERLTILCWDLWPSGPLASALALARWVSGHGPGAPAAVEVEVVSLWDGPWRAAFGAVADVHVVNGGDGEDGGGRDGDPPWQESFDLDGVARPSGGSRRSRRGSPSAVVPDGLRDLGLRRAADGVRGTLLRRRLARDVSPVWLAGAPGARLLHYVPERRPVVAHHGEHADRPDRLPDLSAEDLALLAERPDRWIAGGERAEADLRSWGARAPVTVVPDLLLLDETQPDCAEVRTRLAAEHGIDPGAPLVVSTGAIDWWDTPDAFLQVAWEVHRRPGHDDVRFLWLGEHSDHRMLWPLRHDIAHAGLSDVVHVVCTGTPTSPVLTCADVVLLSRRGAWAPTDLRGLEAIAASLVRWPLHGEAPGRRGATTVVPALDDRAMADAVIGRLHEERGAGSEEGTIGVRNRHTARRVGPVLLDILRSARRGA